MSEQKDGWGEYSKLVLNELVRLNDNHEKMRNDFDSKLQEMNFKLGDIKSIEKNVGTNTAWMEKVNDVWSPNQMKEAKDEIYKQKSRWVAAIAIITFVQIIIGFAISVWSKMQ
jgi:hypothetical protein